MNELLNIFKQTVYRDLIIARRSLREVSNPMLFFILVVTLFPLAISPDPNLLRIIAPGIIWIAALLANLLALDRLFREDFATGTLEQMVLSPYPLTFLLFAKITAHWLLTGLPLLIITPILALMLHLPNSELGALLLSLLFGTPILSFLGSIILALTLGLPNGNILLSLLLLPLYVPVLIFGAGAAIAAGNHLPVSGDLALLAAFCLAAMTISPFVTATTLRLGLSM